MLTSLTDNSKQEYCAKVTRKLADSKISEKILFYSGLFWKKKFNRWKIALNPSFLIKICLHRIYVSQNSYEKLTISAN